MAFLTLRHVAVTGVSAAVPKEDDGIRDIYAKWGDYDNFFSTTGIQRHRISSLGQCSSDLCAVAAERLLADLHWDKSDVDAIVFVSQTPDYILPATSALIQSRLGLREDCYTLDISLGCSGWVYALSTLGALVETGGIKKALLYLPMIIAVMEKRQDGDAFLQPERGGGRRVAECLQCFRNAERVRRMPPGLCGSERCCGASD